MEDMAQRMTATQSYISKILSFVPANLYVPAPEEEEQKHYWTKPTETEKQKMKFESKKAKRLRLDPTSGVMQVEKLMKQRTQVNIPVPDDGGKADEGSGDSEQLQADEADSGDNDKESKSDDDKSQGGKIDKLKQRLAARIANLRDQRKGAGKRLRRALKKSESNSLKNRVNNKKGSKSKKSNKRKTRDDSSSDQVNNSDTSSTETAASSTNVKIKNKSQSAKRRKSSIPQMMSDIKFSSIEGIGKASKHIGAGEPKRKKNLEKLLKEAEKKQRRMAALKEKGSGVVPQYAWDASLERAMGNKVLDDPKLIKKSIKRREKEKAKSRAKWEKRNQSVIDANEKILDRKRENLKKVDMVRQAKKQGKSLKLLDLKPSNQAQQKRPGFEGRRDSPLNSARQQRRDASSK